MEKKQYLNFKPLIIQYQRITDRVRTKKLKCENGCKKDYGFVADSDLPLWKNRQKALSDTPIGVYFNRPSKLAYHNLCSNLKPPKGLGLTLGLGLKFCIQQHKPPLTMHLSLTRFSDDVRKRCLFAGLPNKCPPKKIYIKSDWIPDRTDEDIEERISIFTNCISNKCKTISTLSRPRTNLTRLQQRHISLLRSNKEFIILMCNKNLGPAIMERERYIDLILQEHLLDQQTYQPLEEDDARSLLREFELSVKIILQDNISRFTQDEYTYFQRGFETFQHVPQFYGMPKVHKNKSPPPFRPVISQCRSINAMVSTFIDYKLQKLTRSIPSYIKNSTQLLDELDTLGTLPSNAQLFTSNATSMYTNINIDEGIQAIRNYLAEYKPPNVNIHDDTICDLLSLVMNYNIFQFGSSWWHQTIGTAMGTPCACIYATIFFAYYERKYILSKYKNNLLFYKRQIDDIFGVWINDPLNITAWEDFNSDINNYTSLRWNTEPLSTTVNFLDVTLTIGADGRVQYKTYQKPMNLFLYILSNSAHPPGVLQSLIHGLLQTYRRQNTFEKDFKHFVTLLYRRLRARGYSHDILSPIFQRAGKLLSATTSPLQASQQKSKLKKKNLFFHIKYHPKTISRRQIQLLYNDHCNSPNRRGYSFRNMTTDQGATVRIPKLTIAYSRAIKT